MISCAFNTSVESYVNSMELPLCLTITLRGARTFLSREMKREKDGEAERQTEGQMDRKTL